MNCPKCNAENPDGSVVCNQCGAKFYEEKAAAPPTEPPPATVPNPKKPCCKINIKVILVLALLAGTLVGIFLFVKSFNKKYANGGNEIVVDDVSMDTIAYSEMPEYPNATINDEFDLDDGGKRVTYETEMGTTAKEVMGYYETALTAEGWQRVIRDQDDALLSMVAEDETFVRIWVYFEGIDEPESDPMAMTYIVDFQPPGGEILPIPIQ